MRGWAISLLPLLALVACDGGGSGTSGSITTPPIGTPGPSPSPSSSPITFPTPTPTSGDFFARAAALYTTQPDIASCRQGQLKPEIIANTLQSLNALRALHRLPPATYSAADEPGAQSAALMMAANNALSHTPPPSWRCYTSDGAATAGASNLYGGFGSGLGLLTDEQVLAGWMTDVNNLVADSVGHRRWLLDPFLGAVAYGRVAGASTTSTRADAAVIKVFDTSGPAGPTGPLPAFVAYPFENYPARFWDSRALMSFGVISNATNKWGNTNVNFSNATIGVRARGGAALAISQVRFDNDGYGLPNNLQFYAAGVQPDVTYDVTIDRVQVGSTTTSFSYSFRIVP